MRTVPRSPSLNCGPRKCSTKLSKSVEPVCGDHSTAWPRAPAIEVNVPHSCTVSPAYPGLFSRRVGFSFPGSELEIVKQPTSSAKRIRRDGLAVVAALAGPLDGRVFRLLAHLPSRRIVALMC